MRLIPTSFLAVVLSTTSALSEIAPSDSLSGNYLASRSAVRHMDLQAMVDFSAAALKVDPSNGALAEQLLQAEVMRGNIPAAEGLAPNVIKFNSQQRTARLLLGLKELRAKHYALARGHLNETAYTPFGVLTAGLLNAWTFAGDRQLNAALQELNKLDVQAPFAAYKLFHAALITDYLGNYVRAEAAYKQAVAAAPSSLRIVQAYGNFLERQGRKDDAAKVYKSYLAANDRNLIIQKSLDSLANAGKPAPFVATPLAGAGEALYSVASALSGEKASDAALVYSQLALANANDRTLVLATLAAVQSSMQQYDAANATFEQTPKESLLRNYADTEIAVNLHRMAKSDEAIERLKSILARDPKDTDAMITLGGIYRATSKFEEAAKYYSDALSLLPENDPAKWRVLYDRGIAQDRLKRFEKSDADFRSALKLSKDDAQVLNYLGYSMIDRGVNLEEALGMVRKAVTLKPNDGYITDSLGWAYYTLKRYDEAVTFCEQAVALAPYDAIIAEHLGDVYWRVGRKLEAQFQWQHALDNRPEDSDVQRIKDKLKGGLPEQADGSAAKPSNG